MRKLITFTYTSPINGKITSSKVEHYFLTEFVGNSEYIETIFETRVAPLKCLISYTVEKC